MTPPFQGEAIPDPARRDVAAEIVQRVAELPDRTSPDEWPEAMLVTSDELAAIVRDVLAPDSTAPAPQKCQRPDGCCTPVTCRVDRVCGDEQQFGTRALRGQPGHGQITAPAPKDGCINCSTTDDALFMIDNEEEPFVGPFCSSCFDYIRRYDFAAGYVKSRLAAPAQGEPPPIDWDYVLDEAQGWVANICACGHPDSSHKCLPLPEGRDPNDWPVGECGEPECEGGKCTTFRRVSLRVVRGDLPSAASLSGDRRKQIALLLNKLVLASNAKGYQTDREHPLPEADRITDADIDGLETQILRLVDDSALSGDRLRGLIQQWRDEVDEARDMMSMALPDDAAFLEARANILESCADALDQALTAQTEKR